MRIEIFNNYGKVNFDYNKIVSDVSIYFKKNMELSLILVDKTEIQKVNKEYRKIDKVTDVISFEGDDDNYLGDIFLCIDKVFDQAGDYKHTIAREFAFLLVHGILHLMGYNHQNKEDEEEMFALQEEILTKINYKRVEINE